MNLSDLEDEDEKDKEIHLDDLEKEENTKPKSEIPIDKDSII